MITPVSGPDVLAGWTRRAEVEISLNTSEILTWLLVKTSHNDKTPGIKVRLIHASLRLNTSC